MKIACYALAFNEEVLMPQFVDHYKKFCDKIVIYDNMSTDNTKQIALDSGCEVISWEAVGGGLNDRAYLDIKQNCYKEAREDFDWVMVVDSDELYSHKEGPDGLVSCLEKYKREGITVPKVRGFNMVGEDDNNTDLSKVKKGVFDVSYSKRCLFNPKLDMKWTYGCHPQFGADVLSQVPGLVESEEAEVILYHYKFINLPWVLNRHKAYAERLSEFNKSQNLAVHYNYGRNKITEEYTSLLEQAEVVK